MKNVSLAEAKANMDDLLEAIERGETVTINRDGLPASDADADADADRLKKGRQAMRELRQLRKRSGKTTTEEILAWRDEGRRS